MAPATTLHSDVVEAVVGGGITELELLFNDELFCRKLAPLPPGTSLRWWIDDVVVKTAAAGANDVDKAGIRLLEATTDDDVTGSTTVTFLVPSFFSARRSLSLDIFCSFCNN